MANYIFKVRNKSKIPNIHYDFSHYEGGLLPKKNFYGNKNRYKDIKTRYLSAMKTQLSSQQTNSNFEKLFTTAQGVAEFEDIEKYIEKSLVEEYNTKVDQMNNSYGDITSKYDNALRALRNAASNKKGDSQQRIAIALEAINDIISIFYSQQEAAKLMNAIVQNQPIDTTADKLLGLSKLRSILTKINNKININFQTLSDYLTISSEALESYIDALAQGSVDDWLKKMQGTKGKEVKIELANKPGAEHYVKNKSADIELEKKYITFKRGMRLNGKTLTTDITIDVKNFASAKNYTGKKSSDPFKLVQVGGSKYSLLMKTLHEIYGNSNKTNYQIYNSLAMTYKQAKEGVNNTLDQNYRIIRGMLINQYAERFIAGFDPMNMQRILIINHRAYPVLGVINAIMEDAQKFVNQSDQQYGYQDKGSLFSLIISRPSSKTFNAWRGPEGVNSNLYKYHRATQTKLDIDNLAVRGKLNRTVFNRYLKDHNNSFPI